MQRLTMVREVVMSASEHLSSFERCHRCMVNVNEATRSKYVAAATKCVMYHAPEDNRDRQAAMNHFRRHIAQHLGR